MSDQRSRWIIPVLSRRLRVRIPLQVQRSDCAACVLWMILDYYYQDVPLRALRSSLDVGRIGASALGITEVARSHQFTANGYGATLDGLDQVLLPCIIHWEGTHFVILEGIADERYRLVDPTLGRIEIGRPEMLRSYSGTAIEIAPAVNRSNRPRALAAARRWIIAARHEAPYALAHAAGVLLIAWLLARSGPAAGAAAEAFLAVSGAALLIGGSASLRTIGLQERQQAQMKILVQNAVHRIYSSSFEEASAVPTDTATSVARLPMHLSHETSERELLQPLLLASLLVGSLLWIDQVAVLGVMLSSAVDAVVLSFAAAAQSQTRTRQISKSAALLSLDVQSLRVFVSPRDLMRAALNMLNRNGISSRLAVKSSALEALASPISVLVVPFIILVSWRSGTLDSLPLLAAALWLAILATMSLRHASRCFIRRQSATERVDAERLDESGSVESREGMLPSYGAYLSDVRTASGGHCILLANVSVSYRGCSKPVLTNLTIKLEANSINAIVGASGAGKSTLARVLGGIQHLSHGKILDADIGQPLSQDRLRTLVAIASHEMRLSGAGAREAVSIVCDQGLSDALLSAMSAVSFGERSEPAGSDSVSEKGASTWQSSLSLDSARDRDRVLIARALAAGRPILVLDGVDSRLSNKELASLLHRLKSRGLTVVLLTTDQGRAQQLAGAHIWHLEDGVLTYATKNTSQQEEARYKEETDVPH